MESEWPEKLKEFWDKFAARIRTFQDKILVGDFNMALCQVPNELRSRGVHVTCAAWTRWTMGDAGVHFTRKGPPIGMDSCGIFLVGAAQVKPQWGLGTIPILTEVAVPTLRAVAGDTDDTAFRRELRSYDRSSAPGQH